MIAFIHRRPLLTALTAVMLVLQFFHVRPASADEYTARTYCDPAISTPWLDVGSVHAEFAVLCGARQGYRVNSARTIAVLQRGSIIVPWATWSDRATAGSNTCTDHRRCYGQGSVHSRCSGTSSSEFQMRLRVKEIVKGSSIYGVEFRDVRFFYGPASRTLRCGSHQ